jgi:PhnB protein
MGIYTTIKEINFMKNQSETSPAVFPVSPYLIVRNVAEAVHFYEKAFQFQLSEINPGDDGIPLHAEMTYQGQLMMCGKEGAYGSPLKAPLTSGVESPITLCVYCEDVDKFYTMSLAHGAKSVSAPEDMFWGHRMCQLQDLDGYTWCFMTPTS